MPQVKDLYKQEDTKPAAHNSGQMMDWKRRRERDYILWESQARILL